MPEPYAIRITRGAEADLKSLPIHARNLILDGLEIHLQHEPTTGTRKVKPLRPNPVADWELRLGNYRALYDVHEVDRVVTVQVVGEKIGNRLVVQGKEYNAHESHRPAGSESES